MRQKEAEEHQALTVQRHLRAIAETWPALLQQLPSSSAPDQARGKRTKRAASPIPINAHVSDVIAEITEWTVFLARVLMDETDWTPASTDTPDLLRQIADERVGHFTAHPDEALALGVADDAERLAKLARTTAYPSGRRKIPLNIACIEHGTSDLGERIPCTGSLYTVLVPDESIGDFICDQDPAHRMTPLQWQRSQKRDPIRDRDLDALLHHGRVRYTSDGSVGA